MKGLGLIFFTSYLKYNETFGSADFLKSQKKTFSDRPIYNAMIEYAIDTARRRQLQTVNLNNNRLVGHICSRSSCFFAFYFHFEIMEAGENAAVEKYLRYCCTYEGCVASFGKPSRLEQHTRVHTGEVLKWQGLYFNIFLIFKFILHYQRPFKCTFDGCDKQFTRPAHLKRHMENNHTKTLKASFKY